MKKVTAILCSDIHLREDQPLCRTDDFMEAQDKGLAFLRRLQRKYDVPVIVGGDLFDHWKPSPWLISWTLKRLPTIITVAGQHDLKYHSLKEYTSSGLYVLETAKAANVLRKGISRRIESSTSVYGASWGESLPNKSKTHRPNGHRMLVAHVTTYNKVLPFPGCVAGNARSLLAKLPQFDLILTGDNHKAFTVQFKGRWLVNPGSLFRTTADQVNYRPRIYLWYEEDNSIKKVYMPIDDGVITREHIEKTKEHKDRMNSFIIRMKQDFEVGLSFKKNMKQFLNENKVGKRTRRIIKEAIE